jgi:hypothetical protein
MGQVYQCWWRICREINVFFFPGSNITCFTFHIHLWPIYWLSLVCSVKLREMPSSSALLIHGITYARTAFSTVKLKVKLWRCSIKHHVTKTYREWRYRPRVLDHFTRWRLMVSFTLPVSLPQDLLQSQSVRLRRKIMYCFCRESNPVIELVALSLYRLSYRPVNASFVTAQRSFVWSPFRALCDLFLNFLQLCLRHFYISVVTVGATYVSAVYSNSSAWSVPAVRKRNLNKSRIHAPVETARSVFWDFRFIGLVYSKRK